MKKFHSQEWSISNFPYSLTRNITSHSTENLAFQSLLIDYTTDSHYLTYTFLFISLREYTLFELVPIHKVKMWIQLQIPRIEDGNNFGVSIQVRSTTLQHRTTPSGKNCFFARSPTPSSFPPPNPRASKQAIKNLSRTVIINSCVVG